MAEALEQALPDKETETAEKLLKMARERNLALTTAESCTGGMLAALLTDIPGCSHVFDRGFVPYSEQAKCDLLGIDREQVDRCGAVSKEVAIAMAEGALKRSSANVALAITGFAGPGDADDEEGLVHFACASDQAPTFHREKHFGPVGRARIRRAAIETALTLMEQAIYK